MVGVCAVPQRTAWSREEARGLVVEREAKRCDDERCAPCLRALLYERTSVGDGKGVDCSKTGAVPCVSSGPSECFESFPGEPLEYFGGRASVDVLMKIRGEQTRGRRCRTQEKVAHN